MLRVEEITWYNPPSPEDNGDRLLKRNPSLYIKIVAPIFWWKDTSFHFDAHDLATHKDVTDFCFDEWDKDEPIIKSLSLVVSNKYLIRGSNFRKVLEILPMGTLVMGHVYITYKDVVEYCRDYLNGDLFANDFLPTKREWSDLCETLLDLKGVKDIAERSIEDGK